MRRASAIIALVLVALSWVTALIAAPSAASAAQIAGLTTSATATTGQTSRARGAATIASAVLYAAGSLVCHQRPERSFYRDGAQLPVCARCLGLYAGGLLGVLAWAGVSGLGRHPSAWAQRLALSRNIRLVLILLAVPTLLSATAAWLGWWDAPNHARALLALPLGAAIGAVVCAVAAGDLR